MSIGRPFHENLVRDRVVPDAAKASPFIEAEGARVVPDYKKANRAKRRDAPQASQDGGEDEPTQPLPLVLAGNGQGAHPPTPSDPPVGMQDDETSRVVIHLDEEQRVRCSPAHSGDDLGERVQELGCLGWIEPDGIDLVEIGSGDPAEVKMGPVPHSG
jgi:hypothetical protein